MTDLTHVQCTTCGNMDQETTFCSEIQQYVPKNEQEMAMERLCWVPIQEPPLPDDGTYAIEPESPDETPVEDETGSNNDNVPIPDPPAPPTPPAPSDGEAVIECPGSIAITVILPHEDYEILSLYIKRPGK